MLKYDRRCKGMEAVYLFFHDDFLYKTSLYILCKHPVPWPTETELTIYMLLLQQISLLKYRYLQYRWNHIF